MKINSKVLEKFLDKVSLKGKINEIVLRFKEEGLVIYANTANIGAVSAILKKQSFESYEALGDVGIVDLNKFVKMLKTFNGLVEIKKEETKLHIYNNEGKTISYPLAEESFIDGAQSEEMGLFKKFDGGVSVDNEFLRKGVTNAGIVGVNEVMVEVKDKKLNLVVENDNKVRMVEVADCDYKNIKSFYGEILFDVVNCLEGSINMAVLDNNAPIQLIEKKEDYIVKYLVAPIVKDDEE